MIITKSNLPLSLYFYTMKYFFSDHKMKNSEDYVNSDEMTHDIFNALHNDDVKTLKQFLNSGF